MPVLTTYISHPSSSSYNIIFCVLCSTLDIDVKPLFRKKNDEETFFFFLFSTHTHTHTRSQWIFSFSLSFHYLFFLFLFIIFNWSIFLLDDDYVLYTIACLCKNLFYFLSNNMVRICVKLRSLHFQLNYT